MAANAIADGTRVEYEASANISGGDVVTIGSSVLGVALDDIKNGSTGVIQIVGVFEVPVNVSTAVKAGATLHWDNSATEFVEATSTANASADIRYAGIAYKAIGTSDSKGQVVINVASGRPGA